MASMNQTTSPGDDFLVRPDHAPTPTSAPQAPAATITDELAKLKISISTPHNVSNIESNASSSNVLSNVKTPVDKPNNKGCANCGKVDAKSKCTGCDQAPNADGTPSASVSYCGKECQTAHWPQHRKGCRHMRARKALFRAGRLLQGIWYAVRRESFDNAIVKVEEVDGDLVVHEGDYKVEPTLREGGFYREFPEHLFKNKEDAESCLSLLFCNESLSHMHSAAEWLLKDLCTKITEALVKVTKPVRAARYARDEWQLDWMHSVLKVVLRSGETYAIDLSGAQYGFYEPVILWSKYRERCIEVVSTASIGVDNFSPLGLHARTMLGLTFANPQSDNRTNVQRAIPVLGECLKLQFKQAFGDIKKRYTSGSSLLRLGQPAFEEAERDMVSMAKHTTHDTAEKADVLYPVIVHETDVAFKTLLRAPQYPRGQVLTFHLVKLAGLFNGAWKRDDESGHLVSLSLERCKMDEEYVDKLLSGTLPEQKMWSDMTLSYELRKQARATIQGHMASKEGSAPSSRERPAAITTPTAPTSNGNGHLELDDMPSSPIHPIQEDLMALARLGELRSIQKLFDSGKASATSADPQGITALHWAAINGHYALCHYLIEAGANVNAKGGDAEATPVLWASKRCHLDVVNLLLQQGADPLLTDDQGYNLLHSATLDGNVFQLILLLHQADVPVDIPDSQGHTSLMWAAYKGFPACLDVLLKWGADVHARDELGFTALHWALVKGSYNCIQKLLEYGADRFIANNDGKTPAVTAKEMNSTRQWHRALSDTGFDPSGNPRSFPLAFVKDSKKFLERFFFCWPFFVIGVTLYILSIMPVYFGLPISMITSYLLQLASQKLLKWAPSDMNHMHKTPFLAGVFAATLAWVGIRYITHVLPTTFSSHFFLNLFFVASFGLCAYYYFTAMLMDPGYIPRSASRGQQKATIEELIGAKAFDEQHFCTMCLIRKPLRSKHCRRCNRCVARHDHHCPWLNNCVGVNNHRPFVLYIIFLLTGIAFLIQLTLAYLTLLPTPSPSSTHCAVLKPEFCAQWSKDPFTLLVNGWGSIQMTWTIMLLFVQLTQIARAMTTWEAMRNSHAGPLVTALATGSTSQQGVAGGGPTMGSSRPSAAKESCFGQWKRLLGVDTFVATALHGSRAQEVLAQRRENPFTKGVMRNCADFWCDGEASGVGSVFGGKEMGMGVLGGVKVDYRRLFDLPRGAEEV
ncbi:Palmitoyltransferase akr1, ankyrin repeat-containing protein akr1 [Aureobasidium sp. EXF-10728]|nr:Palmitoyltransferase akr1, ankyrin repeat-containing protein akr1 [Aureobasidium sp. EXF-10728]